MISPILKIEKSEMPWWRILTLQDGEYYLSDNWQGQRAELGLADIKEGDILEYEPSPFKTYRDFKTMRITGVREAGEL